MDMVSKMSCSHFFGQVSYYGYTHACTKLYNKVTSWNSGAYKCHYGWPSPEANSTTVCDLTILPVSSLPLSVMVRVAFSRSINVELDSERFKLSWELLAPARVQIWCIRLFTLNFGIWPQTNIHTYTRVKQCSHASVGLAQPRPNKCIIWYHVIYQLNHGTLENLTTKNLVI